MIKYTSGDGKDTVYGFNATSTLKIGNGNATYSTTKSGNDIIVNVGDGSVLLKDVSSLSAVNISGKKVESNVITLTEGDDDYSNRRDNVTILALGGNDSIINDDGNSVIIIGGSDNDFIYSGGSERVSIDGGAGDDEIYITPVLNSQGTIFSADNTVDGGAGNDVIYDSSAKYSSVNGGTGYDYIISTGKNNTLHGGKDDDLISLKAVSENAVIDYNEGDGNDTVYGFNATSTLKIGNGNATYSTTKSGNDILVRVGNGSVLLKNIASISPANVQGIDPRYGVFTENADTYSNTVAGATLLALGGNDSVTNSAANVYIDGMGGNDSIQNGIFDSNLGSNATITGGTGDDRIINYSGSSVSINGAAGNDFIHNGDIYVRNNSNIFGTNATIDGGAGNDSIYNSGDSVTIDGGDGHDTIHSGGDSVTVDGGAGNDTIHNSGDSVTINGGAGNDSISNGGSSVTIDGGDGTDTIDNRGDSVSIDGGLGDDFIYNVGDSVTIAGGAGNDSIYNVSDSVTIAGGAGNDTIKVGASVTSFTVTDFSAGDVIELNSSVESIGGKNTLTAGNVKINGVTASEDEFVWSIKNGVVTLTKKSTSGAKLSKNGKTITYSDGETETLFTLTGLKSGLTIDQLNKGITISGTTVTVIDINLLSTTDVSITNGYTLKFGGTVTQPTKITAGWKFDGTAVTYTFGGTTDGYVIENGRIVYKAATGGGTFTLTGLKSGLTIEQLNKGITINGTTVTVTDINLLSTTNVSITDGYALKFGGTVTQPTEIPAGWKFDGTSVTYTFPGTTAGYVIENGRIVYKSATNGGTFTLTGLKRGLTVDQLTKGITISGTTVTITDINILSTTNVSISGGYTLKFGGTVTQPTEITSGWKFDGTAVTYTFGGTTDGYILENGRIVYKAKTGGKTFTLTGLRSGVTIDRLNKGITISGTTVTVTDINLLSTTNVSITDGYTLKFGGTVTQPTKITAGWSVNGTTATYTFGGTTDGYVIENGRIVYKPATGGETFTLTGLRSGVTIEQLTKGITISGTTVTITDINILPTTKVSITYGYKFEFDKGITQPTEIPASWSINGTTATYTFGKITDGYVLDEETNTIVYKKETSGSKFTLTGLREGVTVEQLTNGIKVDGTTIIIIDISILGTGTIRISGGYTPKFESDTEPKEISYGWSVNGTTATYTFGGMTDGYVLENGRIVYKKATGGGTFTLTGLRSGVTDEQLTNGVTISGKTVTITDVNLLSTTDVSITDDYTLKFGGTVTQPKEITAGWSVSGTTATYTFGGTTDGYVLENGRIVYKAKTGGETFTLTGLRNGVTIEQLNKGITISDTIVTVTDVNILSTGTLSITDGYRLALGESVKRPESVNSIWQIENGTTGKYYGTSTTDGYRLLNGIIDYRQAIFGNLIFTLTGLRSGVTTEQLTKYVTVDKKTLTVTPEVVGTNFATTTDYQIIFDKGDYSGSTFKVNDTGTYTIWLNGTRLNIDLSNGSGTYNFRSPNGGGNTFLVGTTRGKYNFYDFSNTDLIKLLYSSGTVTPTFQGGNVIFRINGITLTFPNIEGTGMPINIVDDTDTPLIDGTFYKDKVVDGEWISLSANYTGQSYTTEDIPNVDATAVGRNLTLIGGEENNEFIGGNGANLFNGGGGENILTGGKGNDTFVSGGGSDTITDYGVGNDKISLGAELSAYEVDEAGNLTLNVDSGSVTILDGVDKKITFVDGRKTTSQIFTAEGIWNTQKSAVTLSSDTEFFTSADAKKLVTIDGGRTTDVEIIGNAKNNKIFGGDSDDTLNGGAGKDTLTGGDGADVFVFERGKDVITDYTLDDKISLGAAVTNESVNNKGDVILKNGSNSLTVKKFSDNGQTINFADGTSKTYYKEKIVGSDGVTLSASFRDQSFTTDNKVDASLVGKRLTLTGGIENNTIIGGKGPDLLNGGGGENILIGGRGGDTFVNGGGDDTITDYEISDKISLMSAKSFELDGDNVIIGFENGSFTVKDGFDRKISFIEGGKTRVNIFATEGIFDGNKTAITLDAATEKFDANDYSKLVSIDGGLTNGVEIVGNKKANKIFAGNNGATIDGGKGNDSLWGGGGTDKFIYGSGGGKDVIFGFGNEDELQFSGEFTAAVKNNYIAFKVGSTNNAVTLKDFTATSFNVNGETYGVSGNSLTKVS